MINTYTIETEILKRIQDAEIFSSSDIAFPNWDFDPEGKSIYLEERLGVIDERTNSRTTEEGTYVIDLFIRVKRGSGTATLSSKELALGNLFDPRTSTNTYFVLGSLKVNISSVETLTRTVYDDSWMQGIVRLNIKVNKDN